MDVLIDEDDPAAADVRALIKAHLDHSARHSPETSAHSLDLPSLQAPDVTFWTARIDGLLAGCGALKQLAPDHGEVKSMHIAEGHRGLGIGAQMLAHILAIARARSYGRLSLETGSMAAYEPARRLYARFGFDFCPPFADYRIDPYSVYMTLDLAGGADLQN